MVDYSCPMSSSLWDPGLRSSPYLGMQFCGRRKNEQVTWLHLTWQKENTSFSHRRAADNWEKYALQHRSFFGHKYTLPFLMYPKDIYSPLNKSYKSPSISHKFWNLKVPIVQSRCGSFQSRNLWAKKTTSAPSAKNNTHGHSSDWPLRLSLDLMSDTILSSFSERAHP